MTKWRLTGKGRELLVEYVTKDIDFSITELENDKLFNKVKGDDFGSMLDERIPDKKTVYANRAVSMKQLAKCYTKRSVIWGIKMNLLIGILLYNKDLHVNELLKKLGVTKETVKEHIDLLVNCELVKKKEETTHLGDFM